jgi:molecular chaperone DnaK (HSP70)
MRADENNFLGKFTITGIERAKRGEPKINVSFALDSNGILKVTAVDQKTGAAADIEIASRGRSSNEEIERMIKVRGVISYCVLCVVQRHMT